MRDIFTDSDGKVHSNTVNRGKVNPSVWEHYQSYGVKNMCAPFAELVSKTPQPFVTKINDLAFETASYFDDHVLLAGDAFASLRPNLALATEQVANQCLLLREVDEGKMTMAERHRQVALYAERFGLLSRVVACFGTGSRFALLRLLLQVIKLKLRIKFTGK
jgi:hypothetical protein